MFTDPVLQDLLGQVRLAERRGRFYRRRHINRLMLKTQPGVLFVFGDNMRAAGFGGQAYSMRGEPNAVGIPTKWAPTTMEPYYFTDNDRFDPLVIQRLSEAYARLLLGLATGTDVVVPWDGVGTGRAQLPVRAPKLFKIINAGLDILESFAADV